MYIDDDVGAGSAGDAHLTAWTETDEGVIGDGIGVDVVRKPVQQHDRRAIAGAALVVRHVEHAGSDRLQRLKQARARTRGRHGTSRSGRRSAQVCQAPRHAPCNGPTPGTFALRCCLHAIRSPHHGRPAACRAIAIAWKQQSQRRQVSAPAGSLAVARLQRIR